MRRSSEVQKREQKLRELEEKRARIESELEQSATDLTRATSAIAEAERLESFVLLGDASARDAEWARADADEALKDARRRKRTAEGALAELDAQFEEATRALAHAQREATGVAYRDALRKRNQAAEAANEALAAAVERVRELARRRDVAEQVGARAKEACDVVGEDPPEFPEMDEPDLPEGWQWFVEVLQQGPKQPLADSAEAVRRRRDEVRHSEDAEVQRAVASGSIPPGTREHVRVKAERAIAEEARRRQASEDRNWARVR
jgi:hypothetical protein